MRPGLPRTALLALLCTALSTLLAAAVGVEVRQGEPDHEGRPTINLAIDPAEGFTMMVATYKRDENLPPLIKHLTTKPPPSLRHIVIIWQNVGVPLPDFLNATALDTYSTSGVVVSVRESKRNSMNERFRPIVDWDREVYTNDVMIFDDDVVLQRNALEWGYQQFLEANRPGLPGRLVGFSGRDYDEVDGEIRYVVRPRKTYSMVLSNAAWLRKEWLQKYWEASAEMQGLRDYVDEVFNCDDLLINYLVSNLTGQPPLLLQPKTPLRTIGGDGLFHRGSVAVDEDGNDISTAASSSPNGTDEIPAPDASVDAAAGIPSAGHFDQRRQCLSHYFSHFSTFAPVSPRTGKKTPYYPLVRSTTSASQDVEDHSRWLHQGELWEEMDPASLVPAPLNSVVAEDAQEDDTDEWVGLTEEDLAEHAEFSRMLDEMSSEEIDELMAELQEALAKADLEAEESEDDDILVNEEEGFGEVLYEPSLFEEEEVYEAAGRVGKAHDEL